MNSLKIPSPILHLDTLGDNISIDIKREDKIHPLYGGNKWRKLKYNIQAFQSGDFKTLVTFGGAFSNHISATAQLCHDLQIPSVGIIRGTFVDPNNPTLKLAKTCNMQCIHVPKTAYKIKSDSSLIKELIEDLDKPYVIPEGGSNELAKQGLIEMANEIPKATYDHIIVPCGTGMTAFGLLQGIELSTHVHIINVLKNPGIDRLFLDYSEKTNYTIYNDLHHGGYAKISSLLYDFAWTFYNKYQLPLDPIYNAKSVFALFHLIKNKMIDTNSKVLILYTGGNQGITAYNYRHSNKWPH